MGRPSKDTLIPAAEMRIIDAFWELLETHSLQDITIGMIAEKAHCNRGTFYYHFENMDSLMEKALQLVLFSDITIPEIIFRLLSGLSIPVEQSIYLERFSKIKLLVKHGGSEKTTETIKAHVLRMWKLVLCSDGNEIKLETRYVLEYAMSGILGLLMYQSKHDNNYELEELISDSLIREIAQFQLQEICMSEGLSMEQILEKLSLAGSILRISSDNSRPHKQYAMA